MKWEIVKLGNHNPEFPLDFYAGKSKNMCVVYFSGEHCRPKRGGATRMYGGDYVTVPMMSNTKINKQIKFEMELIADSTRNPKGYVVIKDNADKTKDIGYLIIHHNKSLK